MTISCCFSLLLSAALSFGGSSLPDRPTPVAVQPDPLETGTQVDTPVIFELRLKDGSVIYGVVQVDTPDRVVLKTIAGATVDVDRTKIAALQPAHGEVVGGEFRPADSNTTRLLFAPTARALKKGDGYIGVYEFLLPFVQVGVTDRLSMGVGTPLIFFSDESGRPIWLTPKYQFYKGSKTTAAAGVMHFVLFGEDARVGLAYMVATTGTDDNAMTAGIGWAYARYHEDRFNDACFGSTPVAAMACAQPERTTETSGSAVAMLGGERRVGRRVKVVTENYAFKSGGILSFGVRFLGERLSADLGVFAPVAAGDFTVLAPVVNFVWTFGK
jgi:hypothetical protein